MPTPYCVDDFNDKIDSLYRLVIAATKRANQIAHSEIRGFGAVVHGRKATIEALEEFRLGKVGYAIGDEDESLTADLIEDEEDVG